MIRVLFLIFFLFLQFSDALFFGTPVGLRDLGKESICLCRDPAAAGTLSAVPSGEGPSRCLGGVSTDQTSSVRLAVSIRVGVARTEFTSRVPKPSEEAEEGGYNNNMYTPERVLQFR